MQFIRTVSTGLFDKQKQIVNYFNYYNMAYISVNPYNDKLNGKFELISDNELMLKIDDADNAFRKWRKVHIRERAMLLMNLADILEKEKDFHGRTMTSEMGKPVGQSIAEVEKCAYACRYYAKNAEKFLSPRKIMTAGASSFITFEPQGLVFAVMPWNFPYWQVIRCLAPALLSGNGMVLKHASNVPLSALNIEKAVNDAGFPNHLFANIFINHRQANIVLGSPSVRFVSLTGSNRAGEVIASAAGAHIKKCVLELGGSDPLIVFHDANLEKAADGALIGRFQNNGQSCIATKRLFVHEAVYPEFIHMLKQRVESLNIGDPMDTNTYIGPLVNEEAVRELADQVERSVAMGAEIMTGGRAGVPGKCFFEPTIILNVPFDSPAAIEETFGPVLPVFTFNDYDELIKRVNDSIFGLGSSVWTNNSDIIDRISRDIDAGTVTINAFTRSDPALPFGGVKSSGYGRELSEFGILEFVNIKTVSQFGI
ncbi:MAG TPA: NAD-dependent succinate-semialdehyde dehydrogenase [Bacteroidales bacterium]|nr:NAD-dependent succinate-semialdehyde dehydrogenase [Bacteroidales bacterium]